MTIPEKLIKQGAKATGEAYKDNYQTPREILDKVDQFYGKDLWDDPCPKAHTQDNLAPEIFECLANHFIGNFYINPPFSQYAKWVDAYADYMPTQQIWLLENVKTETKYSQKLLGLASAICFLNKRINFLDPRTGEPYKNWDEKKQKWENGSPRTAYLLIYLGDTPRHFRDVFKELGVVISKEDFWNKSY